MAKHRYVVTAEFKAWIPGERDDPKKQSLSIKATERFDLFADLAFGITHTGNDLTQFLHLCDERGLVIGRKGVDIAKWTL